jgi:hypothetical protein
MESVKITRFEFQDLTKKHEEKVEVVEEINETQPETVAETVNDFADQNIMSEMGHEVNPHKELENPNLLKFTKDEIDEMLDKARTDAVNEYAASLVEEKKDDIIESTQKTIAEIKERVEIELDGLVEKTLSLSYAIAGKVIDTKLMKISKEEFVEMLKRRLNDLNFQSSFSLEVGSQEVAEMLKENGIEVSVNNDMLAGDYKIIWCNGFLERNATEVASQIEGILTEQINKI